jgi:hypothetical protein
MEEFDYVAAGDAGTRTTDLVLHPQQHVAASADSAAFIICRLERGLRERLMRMPEKATWR